MRYVSLNNRLKRVEELAGRRPKQIVIIHQNFGEAKDSCLSRHPETMGPDVDFTIILRKDFGKAAPRPRQEPTEKPRQEPNFDLIRPSVTELDKEIESVLSELKSRGVDQEAIEGLIEKELAPHQKADELISLSRR